jgi:flagellar basal body rod protein FlgB
MFHALYTAASGMTAQQINLDNIANNLANSSTSGFQARRVQFSDLLYQSEIMPGSAATQQTTVSSGLQVGLGTRPGNTEIIQTQGDLSSTGNPLDFAGGVFPDERSGSIGYGKRQCAAAGDYYSRERDECNCGQRWHGERYYPRTDSGRAGRDYSACGFPESRWLE